MVTFIFAAALLLFNCCGLFNGLGLVKQNTFFSSSMINGVIQFMTNNLELKRVFFEAVNEMLIWKVNPRL